MISFQFENIDDFYSDAQLQSEWLETNGLGGWSSSTLCGCHTRRYHGLLVAAIKPPTDRMVTVSKLDETITINNQRHELGVNNYGNVVYPNGYRYLKSFSKDLYPQFIYEAGDVQLRKSIVMIHEENTTMLKYEILKAPSGFTIELLPLLAMRGSHQLMHADIHIRPIIEFEKSQLRLHWNETTPDVFIRLLGSAFIQKPNWYYNFNYNVEQYRGLDFVEDLFAPGLFSVDVKEGATFYVVLSTENRTDADAGFLYENEIRRRQELVSKEISPVTRQLALAADQFIVKRDDDLKTVIAGYHWFTDWSRDTMISLPGLTLSTKRFNDAKKILHAFARSVDRGMLPNRFQDNGEPPEYNNVDGTLWYFIAVYKYLKATKDRDFVLNDVLPVLKSIIDWHYKGTRFNIHVDEDGLLYAGEEGYQLTWMDARIGNWVVTPRIGRPVEIQALWYNALIIFSELLELNGQESDAVKMMEEAKKLQESFNKKFWFDDGGYLCDVIDGNGNADTSLRPNQIFAISLPFELVKGEKARSILKIVEEKLYTPKGLRTLSPDDERYICRYGGDQWHRDSAYHQGIAWSWLLGPYIDAIFKTNGSSAALTKAKLVIRNVIPHLAEAGIGTVSEIFDSEPPFTARGCIAQAWGVAEILRVVKNYHLDEVIDKKLLPLSEESSVY